MGPVTEDGGQGIELEGVPACDNSDSSEEETELGVGGAEAFECTLLEVASAALVETKADAQVGSV